LEHVPIFTSAYNVMMPRRKINEEEFHPAIEAHRKQRKSRICIKCDLEFPSKSPGNRICSKCKRLMTDIDLPLSYRSQLKEETEE
jgi:hypothetical protein